MSSNYVLKNKLEGSSLGFYRDFDIFEKKGVDQILGDTLQYPFFELQTDSDTTLLLTLHRKNGSEIFTVPTGEQVIYAHFDIKDGPRHIFAKVFNDKIVRYCYDLNPFGFKYLQDKGVPIPIYYVLPQSVEIINRDTQTIIYADCFLPRGIKDLNFEISPKEIPEYAVYPFEGKFDSYCADKLVYFFDNDGVLWSLRGLNSYENIEKEEDGGLYSYKHEFKFWRDFHNIKQMR